MIRDKGLDYQKIKALSYYNRPQRTAMLSYGGPLTGLTDEELLAMQQGLPTRSSGITVDPRINAPEDNTYTRNLSPEDYADMMQGPNTNSAVDPVRMSMPTFEKPQGQLVNPSDAELSAQKDAYLKASGYKDFNPEDVGDQSKDFNMEDFGALMAANAAGIDNIIKSFRPEKSKTPRVALDRMDMSNARLDMARQSAIQGKIHAGNVRSVAGSSGSALSNLSAGQAANSENLITNFLRSYQAENQQNASIKNQEQMYNVQAEERERIANEQNRAAAMTARNAGLANIGTNYGMYNRDQKAEAENQAYNNMVFKLINEQFPNYSMMSPEERQQANIDIQKMIGRGQFHYTPPV